MNPTSEQCVDDAAGIMVRGKVRCDDFDTYDAKTLLATAGDPEPVTMPDRMAHRWWSLRHLTTGGGCAPHRVGHRRVARQFDRGVRAVPQRWLLHPVGGHILDLPCALGVSGLRDVDAGGGRRDHPLCGSHPSSETENSRKLKWRIQDKGVQL